MTTTFRLPTVRYILATVPRHAWRWQLIETKDHDTLHELVDDNSETSTQVFCVGGALTPVARAIALLNPAVLEEISAEDVMTTAMLERLTRIDVALGWLKHGLMQSHLYEFEKDAGSIQQQVKDVVTQLRQREVFADEQLRSWLQVPPQEGDPPA